MFKRLLVLPLIILLCGCTSKDVVKPILSDISFLGLINFDGEHYSANFELYNDKITICITEPDIVKDLTLIIDKNGVVTDFKDLEIVTGSDSLLGNSFTKVIFDVIKDVSNKTIEYNDNKNYLYKGRINDLGYVFSFSPSGLPLLLTIKDIGFNMEFNNVTIKG